MSAFYQTALANGDGFLFVSTATVAEASKPAEAFLFFYRKKWRRRQGGLSWELSSFPARRGRQFNVGCASQRIGQNKVRSESHDMETDL